MRAMLLVNPTARLADRDLAPARRCLERQGLVLQTPPHPLQVWEFPDYIRQHGIRHDLVIIGGGDGTLSTCAKAASDMQLPIGILPLGTANDLARTLDIPLSPVGAAKVIGAGKSRLIDLGLANGHPFFNVVTVGLAANLASGLSRVTKRRFGRFGYALGALRVALQAQRFTAWISTPAGTEKVKTYQIAIGNGRHYGGGAIVHSGATIHDGMLDLYSLELKALWKLAISFRAFSRGEHGEWDDVRIDRSAAFVVATKRPQPVNADGEIVTQTPLKVEVLREAVRVFAPPTIAAQARDRV